jgi:hypothetical protein
MAVAGAYIESARRQLDTNYRTEVRETAERIAEQIAQHSASDPVDSWTSRPLTFFVLPPLDGGDPYLRESGLADVLPMLLGDRLVADTPMELVDRALINDLLQEQLLAAKVGSETGQVQLGQVLGARLILQGQFIRLGENRKMGLRLVDVETSRRPAVTAVPVNRFADPELLLEKVAEETWNAVREAYPLQARLFVENGVPVINIGNAVGLKSGMAFDLFVDPEVRRLPDVTATVKTVRGDTAAEMELSQPDFVNHLPTGPDNAYYVRERRPNA